MKSLLRSVLILILMCASFSFAAQEGKDDLLKKERENMRKERGGFLPASDPSGQSEVKKSDVENIKSMESRLAKDPSDMKLLLELALVYKMTGNLETAASYYEQALKIQPDQPEALFNLGAIRLETGRARDALLKLQEFVRQYPEDLNIKAAHQAQYRAISDLCVRKEADPSGLLPFERADLVIYRKLKKEEAADGKLQAFLGKEILDRTSQVSIILKNLTEAPIKYNLHYFHLEQEGFNLYYDPARFIPGTEAQPIEGSLDPGKYMYLVIGCPECDLTLPVTLVYDGGGGIDFRKTF